MSCNTPHPTNATPRNDVSCFWHANGNLVCNTSHPSSPPPPSSSVPPTAHTAHSTAPFVLNATNAATYANPTIESFITGAAPLTPTTRSEIAPAAIVPAAPADAPYAEFASFGQPNANYKPNAYRQHTDWYNTQNQPCCDVPCKSCQTSEPSFRSPPRTWAKTTPTGGSSGGQ